MPTWCASQPKKGRARQCKKAGSYSQIDLAVIVNGQAGSWPLDAGALLGGACLCSPALPCVHPFILLMPCCQSAWLAPQPCPGLCACLVVCDCMPTQRHLRWAATILLVWPWCSADALPASLAAGWLAWVWVCPL